MTKKYFALFLALALLLSGCSLAREDAPEETGTDPGDKLIGAFVTTEHLDLFDFEAYLNDHLNEVLDGGVIEGDTSAYKNRIYATKTEEDGHTDYVFQDLDGYPMFAPTIQQPDPLETYITMCVGSGINDLKNGIHSIDDNILEQTLEGTMYLAEDAGRVQFFLNPVYQDDQGRVYLVSGQSLSFDCSTGSSAMSADSEVVTTVDGVETTQRGSVTVNFVGIPCPEEIVVLQMDADSKVLSRETYVPGQLPEEITPTEGTDYFIVETHNAKGVTREILGKDTETMRTYAALENGICDSVLTKILWEA